MSSKYHLIFVIVLMLGIVTSSFAQEETEAPEPEATEMVEATPEAEATEMMETTPEVEATEEATPEAEATEVVEETQPSESEMEAEGTLYTVLPGDTLFRIALRNGLTVADLAEANGITNPNLIFAGQQLIIPDSDEEEEPEATPEPEPPTPEPGDTVEYIVLPGDSLYRLAVLNGTTISVLAELNNIVNPNLIFVGQTLLLPATNDA